MTNEEALKHLTAKLECMTRSKGFREKCDTYNSYEGCYECDLAYKQGNIGEQIESFNLAIKALAQEPCEDSISRQAVMNCFKKWQPYMATRLFGFEKELSSLPSVTPHPCGDAISREQAKSAIRDRFKDLPSRVEINTILNELPSVTSQPKSGHWISCGDVYMCSECDSVGVDYDNYCPNCGTRMEGSE